MITMDSWSDSQITLAFLVFLQWANLWQPPNMLSKLPQFLLMEHGREFMHTFSLFKHVKSGTTILSGIKSAVDESTEISYMENPESEFVKSNNFSYAIVVVGEHPYTEMFGDSSNLTMADPGSSVITNVCGQVKCVVVVISGRPVVIEPYMSVIDALVAAWLPGTEGQGVADVLFGDHEFTGKLSRTWFRTVDQLPMNIGDSHYDPLFPFGYGLTTKSVVERSTSAGMNGRPYLIGILVSLFISLAQRYNA